MAADWIDAFVKETAKVPSPEIFRLWGAITAISGVLERKVFTSGSAGPIYPNLFTVLVGPPASGKTNAIRPVRELWGKMRGLNISPDNVTKAALIDALARSLRTIVNGTSSITTFSSLIVPCPEFGVFFTHHDLEFLSVLNLIYDNPSTPYREERRTSGAVEIIRPHLVILGGTQPDFLNSLLPEEAWGMGFASRLLMIYAESPPIDDIFSVIATQPITLSAKLAEIFDYKGEFIWEDAAKHKLNAWNRHNCPPTPTHTKLLHYNGRRVVHAVKLAMISSVSHSAELRVTVDDFERAKDWLLQAEVVMPDIFRAMGQRSDSQLISDMHFHIYQMWASVAIDRRKPIKMDELYKFLHSRTPSNKIAQLIEVAEKTGYIKRGPYPDEWIPQPLGHFGTA